MQVRTADDVLLCARNMHTDALAPVFLTSAVTGGSGPRLYPGGQSRHMQHPHRGAS